MLKTLSKRHSNNNSTMATYLRNLRQFKASMTMRCQWIFVILIFMVKFKSTHMEIVDVEVECPPSSENSACPCYKFDDGEFKIN